MTTELSPAPPALVTSLEGPPPEGLLSAVSQQVLERASARWSTQFGPGSQAALRKECVRALSRLSEADTPRAMEEAERLCFHLEQEHRTHYGRAALRAELEDARERELSVRNDAALVRYQAKWERKLTRMQRLYSQRWRVPGLSEEEVRDALTLRLIEAVRSDLAGHPQHCRPGKAWGLVVMQQYLGVLRRSFRLGAVPVDFSELSLPEREPNQEERWLEFESDACRALAQERAQSHLSRPQRQWLAAMKLAANCGEFFRASDQLNLSAASRVLGKNRSSAQRAYKELQLHFSRELERYK
jgi:hypothetical protein